MERLTTPRRFVLMRGEDVSGVSGVGIVAHGCDFGDRAVLYWLGDYQTLGVYDSMRSLLAIHGHEGRTWAEWLDGNNGAKRRNIVGLLGAVRAKISQMSKWRSAPAGRPRQRKNV